MTDETLMAVRDVCKSYGDHLVLHDVRLDVRDGESVAFVGKSGGGKSTLLRLMAGLEEADSGTIVQDGGEVRSINANARMMFQEDRLLPWMSVADNVTFASHDEADVDKARGLLELVGLTEYSDDYPTKLSGGQKQRLALARALFSRPRLLLLDEPLGALDALTRRRMQDLIMDVCHAKRVTTILVTHDITEAVRMCGRIALIRNGTIEEVFDNPHQAGDSIEDKEARALLAGGILQRILG